MSPYSNSTYLSSTVSIVYSNYCLTTVVLNWQVHQLLLKLLFNYCSVIMSNYCTVWWFFIDIYYTCTCTCLVFSFLFTITYTTTSICFLLFLFFLCLYNRYFFRDLWCIIYFGYYNRILKKGNWEIWWKRWVITTNTLSIINLSWETLSWFLILHVCIMTQTWGKHLSACAWKHFKHIFWSAWRCFQALFCHKHLCLHLSTL